MGLVLKDEKAWLGKSKEGWGVISGICNEGWGGMSGISNEGWGDMRRE